MNKYDYLLKGQSSLKDDNTKTENENKNNIITLTWHFGAKTITQCVLLTNKLFKNR